MWGLLGAVGQAAHALAVFAALGLFVWSLGAILAAWGAPDER